MDRSLNPLCVRNATYILVEFVVIWCLGSPCASWSPALNDEGNDLQAKAKEMTVI